MNRQTIRTTLLLRRPKRARWTPWRRTMVVHVVVCVAVVLIVVITIARGIQ